MGISDELTAMVGDQPIETAERDRSVWQPLCVCGHLAKSHSTSAGGTVERPPGLPARIPFHFHGCRGEMPHPSIPTQVTQPFGADKTLTVVETPTCPCEEFRPVAEVDRPGRYFHQRRPRDLKDHTRHPFASGIRAYRTRISKFKAIDGDPAKRDAELDRRFRWIEGKRRCSISSCKATDEVWPVFVTDTLSELRCPKHR